MKKSASDIFSKFSSGIILMLGRLLGLLLLPFQIHRYIFWVSKSKQAKRGYYRKLLKGYIRNWIHLGFLDARPTEAQLNNEWMVGGMYVTPHRIHLIKRFRNEFFYIICPFLFQSRYDRVVKK